jgi:hypothetical protein
VDRAGSRYRNTLQDCEVEQAAAEQHTILSACQQEAWAAYNFSIAHSWEKVPIVAFGPLPLFWLIAIYR